MTKQATFRYQYHSATAADVEKEETEDEVPGNGFLEDMGFRHCNGGQIMFDRFGSVWVAVDIVEERRMRIPFDYQKTSLAGLTLDSATSSGLRRAPRSAMQTPSRHHLELQDRRDYTPADRAARTCWLGCPVLLYYLAA
ncbi:hypothetical protein TNCV_4267861 [Trichonephila clavipes]|nr:hypothetical protein TNCV_4267861 [Trichonephila clavipes]